MVGATSRDTPGTTDELAVFLADLAHYPSVQSLGRGGLDEAAVEALGSFTRDEALRGDWTATGEDTAGWPSPVPGTPGLSCRPTAPPVGVTPTGVDQSRQP